MVTNEQDTSAQKKAPSKTFKKLDPESIKRRDELQQRLDGLKDELEMAVDAFNAALNEKWAAIETAVEALNEGIEDANAWQTDMANEIQEFIDEHSERWLESERGQQYNSWSAAFEEEIPTVYIERPEEISMDYEDYIELLGERPEEVDMV